MYKIYTSASKIAFLMMVLAVIGAMFLGKITGEQFLVLAGMAFSYYFTKRDTLPSDKIE